MTAGVVLGSGAGRRMETRMPKVFMKLHGLPLAYYGVKLLAGVESMGKIVLTVPPGWKKRAEKMAEGWSFGDRLEILEGGATRQETVFRALQELPLDSKMVVVHDGARPLATPELVRAVVEGAREHGACIPAVASEETMKLVRGGRVIETLNRDEIHTVQTPQAFYYDVLFQAHAQANERKWRVTDDAALVERMGRPVHVVPGERLNLKITYQADLRLARFLTQAERKHPAGG